MISHHSSITGRICILNDLQLGKNKPALVQKFGGGGVSNTKEKEPSVHFSFDLQDNIGSKIHCVAFDAVAKQMFPKFLLNTVYTIKNFTLQLTNTRYTDVKHACMLVLNLSSIIIEESVEVQNQFRQLDQEELNVIKLENLGNIALHSYIGNTFIQYIAF